MPPRKPRLTPQERAHRAIERMSAGTLQGRAESASPVRAQNVASTPLPTGGSVMAGSRDHYDAAHTVVSDDPALDITWTTGPSGFDPIELLDISDPEFPITTVRGLYVVTLQGLSTTTPVGRVRLNLTVGDHWTRTVEQRMENPADATFDVALAVTMGCYCEIGETISTQVLQVTDDSSDLSMTFHLFVTALYFVE